MVSQIQFQRMIEYSVVKRTLICCTLGLSMLSTMGYAALYHGDDRDDGFPPKMLRRELKVRGCRFFVLHEMDWFIPVRLNM